MGLAGVGLSLGFWLLLVADRRATLLATTTAASAELRAAVEYGLGEQLGVLEGLADLWKEFGLRPLPEWTANVDQRVDRLPGLVSVTWVDLDEPQKRIAVGRERSDSEIELDDAEARLHAAAPHFTGPERDGSGEVIYRIFLPVETRDERGVLVARFQVVPFLEAAVRARSRGYALDVFWDDVPIFSRGTPSSDPWQRWWHVEEPVALPMGGTWRVAHRPTAPYASDRLTPTPHYLLAAGIVLSFVLAMVAYQMQVIARQASSLRASNRSLEGDVADRTAELQDAVNELEAFNYSVSHDLRSPLSAILNFATILEEDYEDRPLDEKARTILGRIRRSASRALQLLEDLLRLSQTGRTTLELAPVDMGALARETFAQVRAAESDSDVELLVDPLPPAVGDRALLGDVFSNLFSNALKYSRGCEKRQVHVAGRFEDGECLYTVVDNGRGFDMRFADKLFALFERLHPEADVEGTGVGLAMVARIVKRHGGRVWGEGTPGNGARFSFTLPRKEAP